MYTISVRGQSNLLWSKGVHMWDEHKETFDLHDLMGKKTIWHSCISDGTTLKHSVWHSCIPNGTTIKHNVWKGICNASYKESLEGRATLSCIKVSTDYSSNKFGHINSHVMLEK
ncbi:hypothetical protein ACJX0J_020885 [Zea mays]